MTATAATRSNANICTRHIFIPLPHKTNSDISILHIKDASLAGRVISVQCSIIGVNKEKTKKNFIISSDDNL